MNLAPGDLILTRSKTGWAGRLIRLGAALRDQPASQNHVAVMSHIKDGVQWGIEGRPGGVGWVDLRKYDDPWTVNNVGQPKTPKQRDLVVAAVKALVGASYDWSAIAADAAIAIGMPDLLSSGGGDVVPGHVVCSSLAAYGYEKAGLDAPGTLADWRTVTPGMWGKLITERMWNRP